MEAWTRLIAGFALAQGIGSLIQTHVQKIRRRPADAPYSVVALVCLVVMALVGIILGQEHGPAKWLFDNVLTPLNGTMFALLGFFVASAAYRTFRVRSFEATLLLSVALVVMLGRVLITAYIHPHLPDWLSQATEWLLSVPNMAQKRGIMLGVALGAISMSLRIILGIERSYLSGE